MMPRGSPVVASNSMSSPVNVGRFRAALPQNVLSSLAPCRRTVPPIAPDLMSMTPSCSPVKRWHTWGHTSVSPCAFRR